LTGPINIPGAIKTLGNRTFYKCTSLTTITISDGLASIGDEVFKDCTSFTSLTIPGSLTSLGDNVFKNIPPSTLTVYGPAGSVMQSYALDAYITYVVR